MIGYLVLTAPWKFIDAKQQPASAEMADKDPYRLHGYPHPTVFKTVRNAFQAAGPRGCVLVLDLQRLPMVSFVTLDPGDKAATVKRWKKRSKFMRGHWDAEARAWVEAEGDPPIEQLAVDAEFNGEMVDMIGIDDVYIHQQIAERQLLAWEQRLAALTARIKREGGG